MVGVVCLWDASRRERHTHTSHVAVAPQSQFTFITTPLPLGPSWPGSQLSLRHSAGHTPRSSRARPLGGPGPIGHTGLVATMATQPGLRMSHGRGPSSLGRPGCGGKDAGPREMMMMMMEGKKPGRQRENQGLKLTGTTVSLREGRCLTAGFPPALTRQPWIGLRTPY